MTKGAKIGMLTFDLLLDRQERCCLAQAVGQAIVLLKIHTKHKLASVTIANNSLKFHEHSSLEQFV
jgi:hypothetical protein